MKLNKIIILALLAALVGSCGNATKQQPVADTLPETKPELPVTQRFLSLITHIDSLGYAFDTVRYTPREPYILHKINDYLLFETETKTTTPFRVKTLSAGMAEKIVIINESAPISVDTIGALDLLKDFDLKSLEKAQKVIQYYFKKKAPRVDDDGTKWYPDGIIEEWTFACESDAQNATKNLMNADLCVIYFNTCAFVCCANEQMYIFYSRASAFMYEPQKRFFKWFLAQNNIELYTLCGH